MWVFGLVLLGGFNLSLINFAALFRTQQFNFWNFIRNYYEVFSINQLVYIGLVVVILFAIFNFLKIVFFVVAHNLIHKTEGKICRLCVHIDAKSIPYINWWGRVLLASLITIVLSAGVGALFNVLIVQTGSVGPMAVILNFIFLVLVVCGIGIWNTFTSYFIVWHDLGFSSAAKASFDLITLKYKQVAEFVFVLSLIYTVAVFIGQAFINGWHHGLYQGRFIEMRSVFLAAFILWTALNNLYFHLAFQLFFDKTVRSTVAEEKTPPLAELS